MARCVFRTTWGFVRRSRLWILPGLAALLSLLIIFSYSSALIDLPIFGPKRYDRLKGKPTVYVDTFERCEPSSQALLKVQNGDSKKTRIKAARIYLNGVKVASEKDFKQKVPAFKKPITIQEHNELKVILKSGHHGYLDKIAKYQARKAELEQELARLQELRNGLSLETSVLSVAKIEGLLKEVHEIKKSLDEHESTYIGMSRGLDDDFEDESEPAGDDEDEIDSGWVAKEREKLDKYREEIKNTVKETEKARDALDKTPKNKRDKDHEKKDGALKELAKLLNELDRAIEKVLDRIEDIEEKIEKIKKKGPSFIIIEIIGKGCDDTPPLISAPEPADGSLLNTAMPRISARYADEYKGSGMDTKTVRMTVDGADVTSDATVSGAGISYTPSSKLPEGRHTVTVSVSDRAKNPASLTWGFTTDTVAPVVSVTSHQNEQYLNTSLITISGTLDDPTATVTVNGQQAQVSGNSFSYAGLSLTEGPNTITVSATDPAGNTGAASITINLDTQAPVITIATPVNNSFVNTPAVTVSGSVSEPVTSLTVNGTAVTPASGNTFTLSGFSLSEGANTITVTTVDRAGNSGTANVIVNLDTVLPVPVITGPTANAYLNTPEVLVTGTVNEPIIQASVNTGTAAINPDQTGFSRSGVTLAEGSNTITATVTDRAGNSGSASISITLDTIAPVVQITSHQTGRFVNTQKVTTTGTVSETVTSVMVNGFAAVVNQDNTWSLADLSLVEGENIITINATDRAGNIGTATLTLIMDSLPPAVQVTSPVHNSYVNTATVTVSGTVKEANPDGFWINDTARELVNGSFSVSGFSLTQGINVIRVKAKDKAGNESTASVFVTLDTTPPTVTLTSPVSGSIMNNATTTITGTVNEPVASVTINGQAAQVSGTGFTLANFTLVEGDNTITAEAVDRAGNSGGATAEVTLDTQAPAVTVSAPGQAAAGQSITISSESSDNLGITLVEILVNGMPVSSITPQSALRIPHSISYTLSPDTALNSVVTLQARAYDTAGNTGSAIAQVTITSGPTGAGYIQGEVYDDSKGLRLEGATADFLATDGQVLTRITTQADGGYFTEAAAGNYLVTLAKTGYTTVERVVTVRPEKNAVAIDARLTPVSSQQNLVNSAGAVIFVPLSASSAIKIELDVPAGALTEQVDIRLTPMSNQGLAGLLSAGWSPIAAVDIRSAGSSIAFAQAATIKIPVSPGLPVTASSSVTLVSYDTATHQSIIRDPGTVSPDGTFITASIHGTGQYALVLSDSGVTSASVGQPLSPDPGPMTLDPTTVSAAGRVVPPVAPPSAGLKAVGEVVLSPSSASSAVSSGLIVTGRVTERFDLFSGEVVLPLEYVQDLVLYHYPCITNFTPHSALRTPQPGEVGSTFPVTPSREYTITELMLGKVGIEVNLRPEETVTGTMVGSDGARLLDSDGNVLVIPQNALSQTVPVETKTVDPATLTGIVGTDFTLLRAVDVNLTNRTLASSAELSVPAPSGLNSALPIVVAKAIEVRGAKKLKLVALARLAGSLISSYVPSAFSAVKGVDSSGTYFFLQSKSALGYINGLVKDGSGNPYASALTTSSTCSLVDLTGADGKYLIAGTVAGFTATATDIYKNDTGTGTGTITSGNQVVTANLLIQVMPPRIVSVTPADNATGVEPNASIVITFSEAVDKTTITSQNIVLKDSNNNALSGVFSINPENTVVTFYPSELLKSETQHTVTISRSIRDLQGYLMGTDVSSAFTVKDTTPPPLPPAGSVTGSFPDANGYVTITGTRGSAEATGTVLIINENSGEIVAVKPESNGSFTGRIMAMLGDDIKVTLMDQAGNQTLISYITFKSEDGRYLVTAKGGIVDGEGGSQLIIPEGALLGHTIVKLTRFAEDQLSHPLPERIQFLAGVKIDAGGAAFQKPVKLSVPAPSNISDMPAGSMPFVAEPQVLKNADGTEEKVFVVHDSAKIIDTAEGKRVSTASPPFPGIQIGSNFVFFFPSFTVAVASGFTYRDMDGLPGYNPQNGDLPVKRAIIRVPGAWDLISYSNSVGGYGAMAEVMNDVPGYPCRDFPMTAIHPLTMNRVSIRPQICEPPYNVIKYNFMLADANSIPPDATAPSIGINLQVAPQQDAGNENARFTAGTIPVNTNITVPVSVTDQEMGTTTLTVTYKTPDMTAGVPYSVMATPPSTPELYIPANADSPAVYKYVYTQSYPSPIGGCGSQCFRPDKPGTYTFSVEARDAAGNRSSKSVQVRAVLTGSTPDGVDGPPAIDEIIPADGAKEIMVTMPVMVTFSEPVQNVNSSTFKLIDVATGLDVPASVYTSIEGGRMRATLQPSHNLMYGKSYKAVLTTGITDSVPNPSSNDALLPLDHQYEAVFTTKVPQVYDLASSFDGAGYGDIALYTHPDGRTFAYVTSNEKGWHAVDVTDPTNPFVTYSKNMTTAVVLWRYRGAAVDAQSGILAITEWIQWLWEGGSQFGYVRFYDIRTNPAEPAWIGQARLAEAASGVPDKVAISGNFAFITTLMVGLQVVDIDASKNYSGNDPGKAIVGGFSTVDLEACPRPDNPSVNQCGSPSDLALVKNNLALIPTFSGSLLVVDVSTPQYPSLITAFQPQGYSARRIAAVSEYAYTDESGNNMVVDLAVTSANFAQGNVHTVDVTEPYNPKILGVVKDTAGNIVNDIFAIDITISKTSGLVYASTASAVYVIDIRDPRHPVLLNIISQVPDATGTLTSLGYSPGLVEKDGWVYLANQQQGMRVLDLDPKELGIERDTEFSEVRIPETDYYPALGTKGLTIYGVISGLPLGNDWGLYLAETVNTNWRIGGAVDAQGMPIPAGPAPAGANAGYLGRFTANESYKKGFMQLYMRWNGGANTFPPDEPFTIKLQARKIGAASLNDATSTKVYAFTFRIRHNGNVILKEVIDNRAIFAADGRDSTSWGDTLDKQRFDFVKELLNQVVPRKRSLIFDNLPAEIAETDKRNYPYYSKMTTGDPPVMVTSTRPFLEETEGRFEKTIAGTNTKSSTSQALEIFRRSFGIGNTSLANASDIMKKVVKDYSAGMTDAQKAQFLYKIVEKETLVGKKVRVPNWFTGLFMNPDNRINGVNGNTVNDSGLYELYKNVVEKFVDNMIDVAGRYAGQQSGTVSDNWRSRNNYGPKGCKNTNPPSCVDEHGSGMSYSYGGIADIETFNSQVSLWQAAPNTAYPLLDPDPATGEKETLTAFYNRILRDYYRGNIDDADGGIDNNTQDGDPIGTKKWAGLYAGRSNTPRTEYRLWEELFESARCDNTFLSTIRAHAYYPLHWVGIDCAAFVQRVVNAADPGVNGSIIDLPDVKTTVMNLGEYEEKCAVNGGVTTYDRAKRAWVEYFFTESNPVQRTYRSDIPQAEGQNRVQKLRLLRKGDLLQYPPSSNISHVSAVYSDRPTCTNPNDSTTCTYEIVHAYGVPSYDFNGNGLAEPNEFSRKVVRTRQDIGATPTGFGRIKLWD